MSKPKAQRAKRPSARPHQNFVLIEHYSGKRTLVPADMVPRLLKAGCWPVDQKEERQIPSIGTD
jgi:hypothetical protein